MKIRALNTACAETSVPQRFCGFLLLASLVVSLQGCASQTAWEDSWEQYAQSVWQQDGSTADDFLIADASQHPTVRAANYSPGFTRTDNLESELGPEPTRNSTSDVPMALARKPDNDQKIRDQKIRLVGFDQLLELDEPAISDSMDRKSVLPKAGPVRPKATRIDAATQKEIDEIEIPSLLGLTKGEIKSYQSIAAPMASSPADEIAKHQGRIRQVNYHTSFQRSGGVRSLAATPSASGPISKSVNRNIDVVPARMSSDSTRDADLIADERRTDSVDGLVGEKPQSVPESQLPRTTPIRSTPANNVADADHVPAMSVPVVRTVLPVLNPFDDIAVPDERSTVNTEPSLQTAIYHTTDTSDGLEFATLPPTDETVIQQAQLDVSANDQSPFTARPVQAPAVESLDSPQPKPAKSAISGVASAVRGLFGGTTNVAQATGKPATKPAGIQLDDLPPVQLHVDDIDVRKVLEMLSRQGQLNILVSPGVSGNITANLENVKFNDALQAVLRLANLVSVPQDNMVYVYTPEEYARINSGVPEISSRIYRLRYLRASDVETMITPFLSADNGRISVTPASDVGIKSDTDLAGGDSLAGAETIVIQDYESVLQRIDQIISELDVEPTQVVIEAVIMEVVLDDSMALGVNFGVLNDAQSVLTVAGNGAALNAAGGFVPGAILTAGKVVDGFAKQNQGLKFGILEDNVSVFIDALESMTETNVLASPRVMVLNKQRAELIIGERIGFKTLTVTQTSTVENVQFLNVGTQLRLRPFVTPDGMIRLEVHPERSTGDVVDGVPRTRTNEITTNVMVPNGATIVLAGLIEEEDITVRSGVPGLSRVPYLGPLFRREEIRTQRKELVVTLTPRIVNPSSILNGVMDAPHGIADMKAQGLEFHSSQHSVTLPRVSPAIQIADQPRKVVTAKADSGSSQQ